MIMIINTSHDYKTEAPERSYEILFFNGFHVQLTPDTNLTQS